MNSSLKSEADRLFMASFAVPFPDWVRDSTVTKTNKAISGIKLLSRVRGGYARVTSLMKQLEEALDADDAELISSIEAKLAPFYRVLKACGELGYTEFRNSLEEVVDNPFPLDVVCLAVSKLTPLKIRACERSERMQEIVSVLKLNYQIAEILLEEPYQISCIFARVVIRGADSELIRVAALYRRDKEFLNSLQECIAGPRLVAITKPVLWEALFCLLSIEYKKDEPSSYLFQDGEASPTRNLAAIDFYRPIIKAISDGETRKGAIEKIASQQKVESCYRYPRDAKEIRSLYSHVKECLQSSGSCKKQRRFVFSELAKILQSVKD
ncbi:MAG: hypothetical protein MUC92_13485 [Fimbriimonadaceae bacterium]|jgi:hypothetical protein|nr:hypothetical protein [Fimbriimonadaceae bacterium]